MKFKRFDVDEKVEAIGPDDMPDEVRTQFMRQVEAYENATPVCLFESLETGGTELPAPDSLKRGEMSSKLADIFRHLALLRVYIENTDHLDDRELYTLLWTDLLREDVIIFPDDPNGGFHLDIIGSGSEQDTEIWLRFYADDETRAQWLKEWGDPLPPKAKLPYARDRHLPKRQWEFGNA
jgi:hypothetical protein